MQRSCWRVQTSAQGLPFLSVSAGGSAWRKQRPQVQPKEMIWYSCSFWSAHGSAALLAEMGIAQRHLWLGTSFFAPLLSKTLSRATGEVGGNLWEEAMFSLPHLGKLKVSPHSSACCEGAEQERVVFRGCFLPGQGLRAAPSGTSPPQLPQALSGMEHPALTADSMLPSRPGLFFLTPNKSSRICPGRGCGAAWHIQAAPCESTGMSSDLPAFLRHTQTITVPSLLAGQLLSWVSLYHLQRVYGSHIAFSLSPQGSLIVLLPRASNMVASWVPHSYLQACLLALSAQDPQWDGQQPCA